MPIQYQLKNTHAGVYRAIQDLKAVPPEVNQYAVLEICDRALSEFKQTLHPGDILFVDIPVQYKNGVKLALDKLELNGFHVRSTVAGYQTLQLIFSFDLSDGWDWK